MRGDRAGPGRHRRQVGPGGQAEHRHRVPARGHRLGRREPADARHGGRRRTARTRSPAIPELLRTLDLAGAIVTIDAAGCQVENARIIRRAGRALPAGREGQPADAAGGRRGGVRPGLRGRLRGRPVRRPRVGRGRPRAARGAVRDGRSTTRQGCRPSGRTWRRWCRSNREREVGGERAVTSHYYITSHAGTAAEFGRLGAGPLGHRERAALGPRRGLPGGRSRIRAGHAGANLALIRRVAVSLLRRAPGKGSGVTKRLKAGWDDEYLLQVLQGIPASIVR